MCVGGRPLSRAGPGGQKLQAKGELGSAACPDADLGRPLETLASRRGRGPLQPNFLARLALSSTGYPPRREPSLCVE